MTDAPLLVEPVPALARLSRYTVGRAPFETDLILDFNESLAPLPVSGPAPEAPTANLYPWTAQLETQLAERLNIEAQRVIVTCGADDALERSVKSVCFPGRRVVLIRPTYGMVRRYAILAGVEIVDVPWWDGPFPADAVCRTVGDDAALLYLVSPNNPTGLVITRDEFSSVAERLPRTLILHDQAYREFADPEYDLTEAALSHPNVVLVRTFSKAWGGAGLRTGYAVGDPRVVDWLRRVGQPFPVSRLSLEILEAAVSQTTEPARERVDRIRSQRAFLIRLLKELGAEPLPSQASFVLARFEDAPLVRTAMAALGIAIRGFPGRSELDPWLRTTLPGDEGAFERLIAAFRTVLRPEAILVEREDGHPNLEVVASDPGTSVSKSIAPDRLSGCHAWVVCRSPEVVHVSRTAGCLPIGLATSDGQAAALMNAGAVRVVASLDEVRAMTGGLLHPG